MQGHPTKHYTRRGATKVNSPHLLFEVRLRFHDVRSDYHHSDTGFYRTIWIDSEEVAWARDMVSAVVVDDLVEIPPPRILNWPITADEQIVRYFAALCRKKILRNYELNLYADATESPDDFVKRCESAVSEERRTELVKIRDVYLRRFLDLEQRHTSALNDSDWVGEFLDARVSQVRDVFRGIREQFSRCFLRDHLNPLPDSDLNLAEVDDVELRERLEEIRQEFLGAYNRLTERYRTQVLAVETYEVPLNHSQVELMTRAVLWE